MKKMLRNPMIEAPGSIYQIAKRDRNFFYLKSKQDNVITFNFRSKRELKVSLTILTPVFWFIDFEAE